MKNKLLVSVFALAIVAFAITSCEKPKTDVTAVCSDMIKSSLHKTPRSLVSLEGEVLTIEEYEFASSDINDNRLIYRTIAFGNGVETEKLVDNMTYEYGEWRDNNTTYTLNVYPSDGPAYTLLYRGNAFITPEGHIIGGEGLDNAARVEKFEKVVNSFPNTEWEATYAAEYVMDSIFRDSIRTTFIPPMTFKYDTIKIFTGKMDTLSADTTCRYVYEFNQDANTNVTTGHLYRESIRSTYNRETKETTIVTKEVAEYDYNWLFTEVSSDSKFVITIKSTSDASEPERLSISKYKLDDAGKPAEFLLGGLTFRPVLIP